MGRRLASLFLTSLGVLIFIPLFGAAQQRDDAAPKNTAGDRPKTSAPVASEVQPAQPVARVSPAGAPPVRRPPAASEKAEEYFKNIQALKGIPADQIVPAMEFMAAALGVDCGFCHVDQSPELDDKEHKTVAREMIRMTNAINRDSFEGQREVTCVTCHRGEEHPLSIPEVATSDGAPEPAASRPASRPSVDSVLEKYTSAVGGAEALGKVGSRIQKGTLTGVAPEPLAVEIYAKAPNRRASVLETPTGDMVTVFDGKRGWSGGAGRPPHDLTDAENLTASLDAAFPLASQVKQLFKDLRVARPGKIDGRDALRVIGRNEGKPPVELWFDSDSGLLVRTIRYEETPLGRNPIQTDYADYRVADGIKIPYQWIVARPGGRIVVQIKEVRHNVPIDDARFERAGS